MSHALTEHPAEPAVPGEDTTTWIEPIATPSAPHDTARRSPSWGRRVLLDSAYNVSALALAVPAFVLMVTGLAVGVALAVTLFGLPVLALTAYVARGFAHVERRRVRTLLYADAPTPHYRRARDESGWLRRAVAPLTDPQSWLDIVWSVVGFATSILAFVATVVWWSVTAGGLTYWVWQRYIPFDDEGNQTLAELLGFGDGRRAESVLMLIIGVVALLTLPFVMRLVALVQSSLSRVMLSSRGVLQQEMTRLEDTRHAARLAEAGSLRRLERDIHDGPQQRLVRLGMDLGRARKQLDTDPDLARTTIDTALKQAREAVEELRSLSRGIAPPILVDRGLAAALQELAGRAAVPVTAAIDDLGEVPPHVETAAYYVASEALTNVAKHSGVDHARLDVRRDGDLLAVEVVDHGVGGAASGKGHGLAGLEQRVRAADGVLRIDSPAGGPTTIRAELPCA
ncbi:sensor histidine kinase [Nocardioides sp. Soil796]|uniref:sensor histidine kinase n=1 Tax=Nocardioides sp. Soil796 TaxID=1736412 RepID=UPI00070AEA68|nr:sensor histidine kinase [Nocardioides sp. Soil796]KRF14974.1 hypothetical protein ASH02_12015 [Nocardioides sp. Soil796]